MSYVVSVANTETGDIDTYVFESPVLVIPEDGSSYVRYPRISVHDKPALQN